MKMNEAVIYFNIDWSSKYNVKGKKLWKNMYRKLYTGSYDLSNI